MSCQYDNHLTPGYGTGTTKASDIIKNITIKGVDVSFIMENLKVNAYISGKLIASSYSLHNTKVLASRYIQSGNLQILNY